VPTTAEIPSIEIHHLQTRTGASGTGAKGVGDGGTVGSAAAVGRRMKLEPLRR
jgi:aerobic carbon-monoxide dehydrogenase large subunit